MTTHELAKKLLQKPDQPVFLEVAPFQVQAVLGLLEATVEEPSVLITSVDPTWTLEGGSIQDPDKLYGGKDTQVTNPQFFDQR